MSMYDKAGEILRDDDATPTASVFAVYIDNDGDRWFRRADGKVIDPADYRKGSEDEDWWLDFDEIDEQWGPLIPEAAVPKHKPDSADETGYWRDRALRAEDSAVEIATQLDEVQRNLDTLGTLARDADRERVTAETKLAEAANSVERLSKANAELELNAKAAVEQEGYFRRDIEAAYGRSAALGLRVAELEEENGKLRTAALEGQRLQGVLASALLGYEEATK